MQEIVKHFQAMKKRKSHFISICDFWFLTKFELRISVTNQIVIDSHSNGFDENSWHWRIFFWCMFEAIISLIIRKQSHSCFSFLLCHPTKVDFLFSFYLEFISSSFWFAFFIFWIMLIFYIIQVLLISLSFGVIL